MTHECLTEKKIERSEKKEASYCDLQAEHEKLRIMTEDLKNKSKNPFIRIFKKQVIKEGQEACRQLQLEVDVLMALLKQRDELVFSKAPESLIDEANALFFDFKESEKMSDKNALESIDTLIKNTITDFWSSKREKNDDTALKDHLSCLRGYVSDRRSDRFAIYYKDEKYVKCIFERQRHLQARIMLEKELESLHQRITALGEDSKNPELRLDSKAIVQQASMIKAQTQRIMTELSIIEDRYKLFDAMLQEIKLRLGYTTTDHGFR